MINGDSYIVHRRYLNFNVNFQLALFTVIFSIDA